jgi:hypothetical protein
MTDNSEPTATQQVTAQELAEVIAQLEPQLAEIDAKLQQWRERQAALSTSN